MIQFVLTLASTPHILGLAILLFLVFTGSRGKTNAIEFEFSIGLLHTSPGRKAIDPVHLVPGTEITLAPGTKITGGSRFGRLLSLAWGGMRSLGAGFARAIGTGFLAILAAIGLHIVIAIASALLTPRPAAPGPVERSASFALPVAMTEADIALLKAQAVLLRTLSPTKGPSGTYAPLEVGAAIADAMRRATATR